jgi:CTP:molybdopterin cytidylyltransferase MocA
MPCAIVLAAGFSTRLGQPKQSVRIAGETLLERTVRIAREASLAPVFVVVSSELCHPALSGAMLLVNHEAREGMASSIRAGVRAAMEIHAEGAVILACDQIAVTVEHVRRVIFTGGRQEVVASGYADRKGVPAYFPKSAFLELMALHGDVGARELLREARTVPLAGGELDIDTAEDLARAWLLYPERPR